jgi:hypothetical protein
MQIWIRDPESFLLGIRDEKIRIRNAACLDITILFCFCLYRTVHCAAHNICFLCS